jgi:hypothetical protein
MSIAAYLLLSLALGGQDPAPPADPRLVTHEAPRPAAVRRSTLAGLVVVDAGAAPRWSGERISLSTKDADHVELLRTFARLADVNLVIDPAVRGTVTVELHDVPWDQALWVILETQGLGAELDGRIWGVNPASGSGR